MKTDQRPPSFSSRVRAAEVPPDGLTLDIDVEAGDRARIARDLGLQGLERMRVLATVLPWRRSGMRVEGTVTARVEQICVVSLEPVWSDIEETFTATFMPAGKSRPEARKEIEIDALEDEEPPETMVDGMVDVGALALEYLALAIDPYPRLPDVRLEDEMPAADGGAKGSEGRRGAFEILKTLKQEAGGGDDE